MKYDVNSVKQYLEALPEERKKAMNKLRKVISSNLPEGFEEQFTYGMISYVVPLSIYPKGYKAKKDEPLPFISIASQKNHIALYHMGIYGNKEVEKWFVEEYQNRVSTKLDMGKSCIRFKNPENIPYDLIGELCTRISTEEHIQSYKNATEK